MEAWAKRDVAGGWHSLVDHSADVSSVLYALGSLPLIRERFRRLAQGSEGRDARVWDQLAALAFLHDIGYPGSSARAEIDLLQIGNFSPGDGFLRPRGDRPSQPIGNSVHFAVPPPARRST